MNKERLWRTLGNAKAWFYVHATTEAEALYKVATGNYEDVQYESPEANCEEAFLVEEKLFLLSLDDSRNSEIDIGGHVVITEEELQSFNEALEEIEFLFFPIRADVVVLYEAPEVVRSVVNIKEITEKQFEVLESLDMTNIGFAESLLERVINYKNYL